MMLEGDGLTAEEIITFYTSTKDLEPKTATEENIKKWVAEIESQNTTGKVDGKNVVGEMPADMQYAIETDLK